MKKIFYIYCVITGFIFCQVNYTPKYSFIQGNNINTIFMSNGVYNYDWFTFTNRDAGFIWPVSSTTRKTMVYTSGIFIGAKVGPQRELRLAASSYASHYTAGNIPVIGQVPPSSVCSDTSWKVYLVNLSDPSLINGGVRTKFAGGRTYTFYYTSWSNWPIAKGAPFAEINNIPGYQPSWNGDRPGIGNGSKARPDELLFTVYMDYTNCTNNIHHSELSLPGGTLPLGIEIHQLAFMFNCPALKDMYFTKWRFINKSQYNWDSAYITMYNDADMEYYHNDVGGCDTLLNLGFGYNKDSIDYIYGVNPPAIGYRYLQSPIRYTGNNLDTAKLPYDTLVGYKLCGLTAYFLFVNAHPDPCWDDPDDAWAAYNFMKGLDACGRPLINPITLQPTKFMFPGNACNRTGWYDTNLSNFRDISTSGPFSMNVSDTQIVTVSYVIGYSGNNFQNVCIMKNYSDSALRYYYNDFQTCIPIGIQPISSEVPDRFMLYQNYPNPFNPTTKIKFGIPAGTLRGVFVQIKIYDILGREISTLVNEELQPGIYEVDWLAENYPSGVYFYTISTDNYFDSKKMVLLK